MLSAAEEREVLFDADIRVVLKKARSLPKVEVPTVLRKLHPLVQDTKEWLDYRFDTRPPLERPRPERDPIETAIYQGSVRRALAFLDALVKAVFRVGGVVELGGERWQQSTVVSVCGERVTRIRLRERYRQVPRTSPPRDILDTRKCEEVPTGLLVLDSGSSYRGDVHCEDTERGHRIEDAINELIVGWVVAAGEGRIARRRAAEEQARRQEEQRQRREREAQLLERQRAEQARLDELRAAASNWAEAQRLRAYLQAVEASVLQRHGVIDPGSELAQWLTWAREQADRLDPLTESPPSVLDERI
jgi:hypothetical protein